MKALILCAGRGDRLRPLTDTTPKPLIEVGGKTLLEQHIVRLHRAGFSSLVVNTAHLGDQIEAYVGDGSRWGVQIRVSREGPVPLETGGGMLHALPLLGPEPFVVVNGDILCDYPLESLRDKTSKNVHLVLVENPDHNSDGDFGLNVIGSETQLINQPSYTYSGIGVYSPKLLAGQKPGIFSVVPLIREAADRRQATGELYRGAWFDIGTPSRLHDAQREWRNDLNHACNHPVN